MTAFAAIVVAALLALAAWVGWKLNQRSVFRWLPSYLRGDWAGHRERRRAPRSGLTHIILCVADHFEPGVRGADDATQRRRVDHWVQRYPETFGAFRDHDGRPPRHTFFYPAEEYKFEHIERLGELVRAGYGEIEVHLHHDADTSDGLRKKLTEFVSQLSAHGHLGTRRGDGRVQFGFVHGNWTLDNSGPDGRWCGVNDELRVLAECGCYADFTLPSAPSPTQTRRINSIYYATDDPHRPFSHDDGVEVRVGGAPSGNLMIIQGPLCIIWSGGKFGLLPRLENADLHGLHRLDSRRAAAWIRTRVCVAGRPDWLFVKLHTHGCLERNWPLLFGPPMVALHRTLSEKYNDGRRYALHYVTAREMYNIVKAAERNLGGNPGEYRDLEIAPPRCARRPIAGLEADC